MLKFKLPPGRSRMSGPSRLTNGRRPAPSAWGLSTSRDVLLPAAQGVLEPSRAGHSQLRMARIRAGRGTSGGLIKPDPRFPPEIRARSCLPSAGPATPSGAPENPARNLLT